MQPKPILCPQCGKPTLYSTENSFRPFCSERCRLIDLGQWANESYRVPVQSETPDQDIDLDETDNESSDDHDSDPFNS